jgi:hypothetical protein
MKLTVNVIFAEIRFRRSSLSAKVESVKFIFGENVLIQTDNIQFYSVIGYPNLISLHIRCAENYYIEQFLLDTKTYAPRLTEIEICYNQLKTVTQNFTRDTTRHSCGNVKRLIFECRIDHVNKNIH